MPAIRPLRVERDQRHLGLLGFAQFRLFRPPPLIQLFIHFHHAEPYRVRSSALQVKVQGRIDAVTLRQQVTLRKLLEQLVLNQVHEIRRLGSFNIPGITPSRAPEAFSASAAVM